MKRILWLFLPVLILSACTEQTDFNTDVNDIENINSLVSSVKENADKYDVSKFEEYKLDSVIDGDTIRIIYNGNSEKVRFLLIDTPETNHETLGEQPYGPEAKEFTKQLLAGQDKVYLEFDVSYRDKYQRLLAYIYTQDGISVQEQLLKNGLARVAYIYDPNTKYVDRFKSIQETAQQSAIGIWSVEDYVTNRGYDKEAFNAAAGMRNGEQQDKTTADDDSCEIKGNINRKGNKIYHMPGQLDYENTVAEEMFCSVKEAEEAGFIPASR
ncbi:thermonuclease family protein [Solibacillus sp. FSL W7-1324]|uniref:thermonuclease family protein n=1 Tax=Solibacillus sp. FSL W7-1324 TaxID=2921701 RepID=UPI0030F97107